MPKFDYQCDKCGSTDIDTFKCKCGGTFRLVNGMTGMLDPFKPYVLENGVENPTLISSREERDRLFKEKDLVQKSYPNKRYSPYSRIFPVSGRASKGSGTRWTGDGVSY